MGIVKDGTECLRRSGPVFGVVVPLHSSDQNAVDNKFPGVKRCLNNQKDLFSIYRRMYTDEPDGTVGIFKSYVAVVLLVGGGLRN